MAIQESNQRSFVRHPFEADKPIKLTVNGVPYDAHLTDYNMHGFGVVTAQSLGNRLELGQSVILETQDTKIECRIKHCSVKGATASAGLEVLPDPKATLLTFKNTDLNWDLIDDLETIGNIVGDLVGKSCPVILTLSQGGYETEASFKAKTDSGAITLALTESAPTAPATGHLRCNFWLYETNHLCEVAIQSAKAGEIQVQSPDKIVRLLRRETTRVPDPDQSPFSKVSLESSLLGRSPEGIRIHDFNEKGLSLIDETGWAHAPKGIPFSSITIETKAGQTIRGHGVLRGVRYVDDEKTPAVGIEFTTASYDNRTTWNNVVLENRYPALKFDYKPEDHKQIWDLYDRSGYLDMKPRESFAPLVDITTQAWSDLSSAGTGLAKRLIIRSEGNVIGTMQLDRIYPKTWCAHSLALDPKLSKVIAGQIYAATADILSTEGAAYLLTITNADLQWNQRNYYDFVARYPFPEHNELKKLYLFEADLKAGWALEPCEGLDIRPANQYDLRRIERYFELYGSELERDALGFSNEHLTLQTLADELKPYNLLRQREFIVGTKDNQMLGFAYVETGTPGVSLFGMQYTTYVYLLPEIKEKPEAVYEGLLKEALEISRRAGVPSMNIYMPDCRKEHFESRGLRYIEEAIRWISNCTAARRYTAFTQMMYGHLMIRRELHKKKLKES